LQIIDLKQIHKYYGTQVSLRGGHAQEGYAKERNQKLECG
jgi:hypothetical protein